MLYQSTRGGSGKITFEEAIIKGIADDGGLYVPERIPKVGPGFIAALADMSYADAAAEIIKLYADGFTNAEIKDCAANAYNERSFSSPDVTPLRKLGGGVHVMELFHGPTAAFKDVALQLLPPMLTVALRKTGVTDTVAILVATSGDTGKAALEGYRDVPGTSILVFYPRDGVSEAQKLQMITQEGENTAVASVEGNFDDAQTGVKAIFADADTNARLRRLGMRLSSANSINWGRLMPQIVYYFRAYATLLKSCEIKDGEQITFVVPTGNFGNILAGWYAREMGLPVSRFICASNSNNVLADFIRTGIYDKNRDFKVTMSPAMDILISSNLERLLYEISDRDAERVAGWMGELAKTGRYNVGGQAYNKLTDLFIGGYADETETAAAIRDAYEKYGYLLDTHTAVGMHVLKNSVGAGNRDINAPGGKTVVAATASPYKFARDVYFAIRGSAAMDAGESSANEGDIQYIELLSRVRGAPPVPASLRNLREKPVRHFTETTKENMKATAIKLLSGIGPHTRQ